MYNVTVREDTAIFEIDKRKLPAGISQRSIYDRGKKNLEQSVGQTEPAQSNIVHSEK